MKHFILIVSASLLALPLFGQEKSPQLKDEKDKYSYSMGMSLGFRLEEQKAYINPDIVAAGLKDLIAGKPQMTEEQAQDVIMQFQKELVQKTEGIGREKQDRRRKVPRGKQKETGGKNNCERLAIQSGERGNRSATQTD